MTVQLRATTTATGLTGELVNMEITDNTTTKFNPTNKTFNITIGAPLDQVTLDENSEDAPGARSNVDVLVYRTIKANEWGTICLPFGMSAAQVKEAFGDDVKLADLADWSFTGTLDNAQSINMVFSSATAIEKIILI